MCEELKKEIEEAKKLRKNRKKKKRKGITKEI